MNKDAALKVSLVIMAYSITAVVLVLFAPLDIASINSNHPVLRPYLGFFQLGFPYFLIAIALSGIVSIIQVSLQGALLKPVYRTLSVYGIAVLLYFLISQYAPIQLRELSIYLLLAMILLSTYFMLNNLLRSCKQYTLGAISKFLVLFSLAIVLQIAALTLSNNQEIANIFMFGFSLGAFTSLAAPLQNSSGKAKRKIGAAFAKGTASLIILGILIGVYIYFFRPQLLERYSNMVIVAEWLAIGLAALIALLSLRSKIAPVTGPLLLENWQKHQQELGFRTTEDFLVLTEAIDTFIQSGRKNDVLLFLFRFLYENKVSPENMNMTLDELVNYQSKPKPRLFFSWDDRFLEQEELEKRKQLMKNLIKNLNADLFRSNWS
jgi:hypothetical protein